MLKKLMKHELRATARIILPLFLAVMVLSVFTSFATRGGFDSTNSFISIVSILVTSGYGIALFALFVVILVLLINRFRNNLLGDEGYVMFTLPVSVHQLVWSKIIVSSLWFVGSWIVVGLSALIITADVAFFRDLSAFFQQIWTEFNGIYALNGTAIIIECIILFFVSYAACCLQFYASLAVGHSFDRRKSLYSILFFFATTFIIQIIISLLFSNSLFFDFHFEVSNAMAAVHLSFGITIALVAIYGAIFYFLTTKMLKTRLNLE